MAQVVTTADKHGAASPLLVHRATPEAADAFFAPRAPTLRAIADPDGRLFAAFGLERGSLWQLLGPAVFWRGFMALLKGNFVGRPSGNETQMPGAFLVRGRTILSAHVARHAGDQPDLVAMLRALEPDAGRPTPGRTGDDAAIRQLEARHRKLLAEARDLQRSGDLRAFAAATERADEIGRQLDALERGSA